MSIVKRLSSVLEPAPHIDPIDDPQQVDQLYKYWRIRIFYSMFVGYAFYYFTRKSFTFAMPSMIRELGMDKADLGILASILSVAYGLSKFTSGILADRSNPRYFMAIGLILTGVFNICFGLSSSLFLFAVFWGLNGWFQGWGWPPCCRYLTHWYSQSERGRWWSAWNTSHNIGGAIIAVFAAFCAQKFGWQFALFIPGIVCILMGFFLINRLRDTPQSLGLPSVEDYRQDYTGLGSKAKSGNEKELSIKEILFKYVLSNRAIWLLATANFFVYVVRTAVNDWSALYLVEFRGYTQVGAGLCVGWFEVGGFIGSLAAGWLSDTVFRGKRGPVNTIFAFGLVSSILFMWLAPMKSMYIDILSMSMLGFWIFGPQMLIGMYAAELAHKKASATASGFTGWFGYVGAAAAGYPIGRIIEDSGWSGYFLVLTICACISVFLLIPLWQITESKKALKTKPKPA